MIDGIIWIFTSRCNMACPHCYISPRLTALTEMKLEDKLRLIREAGELGIDFIGLSGGEPLIHPHFEAMLKEIAEYDIRTSLVTNGTVVSDSVARLLSECETQVYVSVDGPPSVHETLRGPGSWEKMSRGVKKLLDYGVSIATVMAVTRNNYTQTSEYVEEALNLGADYVALIPTMPAGRALSSGLFVGRKEYLKAVSDAVEKCGELGVDLVLWCTPFAPLIAKKLYVHYSTCRPSDIIDIDPGGRLLLCDVLDIVVGSVAEGLERAAELYEKHPLVRLVTNPPELPEICRECPLVGSCRGGCYARSLLLRGSLNAGDPLCPRFTQTS